LLAAAIIAAPACASAAASPVYQPITIAGRPGPVKHSPRPPLSEEARRDLSSPVLISDGSVPALTTGPIAKGQSFLTVGVKHGLTGVLAGEVKENGFLKSGKLAAGAAVYGLPMGGPDGPGVVWCAPKAELASGAKHWSAVCLPFGDHSNVWVKGKPAMFPVTLNWNQELEDKADTPQVRRQAVDFPAMTLSYAFAGWDQKGWLLVEVRLDWGEGPQVIRSIALPLDKDGAVALALMDGSIVLKRPGGASTTPDQMIAEAKAPPKAGATIVY
jgi:hypothetical protein